MPVFTVRHTNVHQTVQNAIIPHAEFDTSSRNAARHHTMVLRFQEVLSGKGRVESYLALAAWPGLQ